MKILIKNCIVCGTEFTRSKNCGLPEWKNRRKFCSVRCGNVWRIGKHFSPETEFSKKRHYVPSTAYKKGQRPSVKTEFKKGLVPWNKGIKPDKKWYDKMKNAGFFAPKWGEKSGNWKGGITKLAIVIRTSTIYKQWRTSIFIRDHYTCQSCRAKRKKGDRVILQVHHKKAFYKILEENKITTVQQAKDCKELWDLKNGETLCIPCHKQTKSYLLNQHTK